ncbi:SEC14-like protein 2 isoform X2 [Folsomia candida]|nr:SEC14-like protein 2 isoform X2 [Folsomia candida]
MMRDELDEERLSSDMYLLRWLRAREMNPQKAALMLRTSMKWRQENKVDQVLHEIIDQDISDLIGGFFQAFDKFGRPVVALPGGEWDVRKPLDDGRKPELIRFLIMSLEIFEETLKMIYKYGYPNQTPMIITKFTVIFDLKHFTYAKFAHKRSVEALLDLVKIYEANYPETLGRCLIINSPRIFSMLFAIVKPFLSENTVNKISIFDSNEANWKKAVEEVIDPSQLPIRYGGRVENPALMD